MSAVEKAREQLLSSGSWSVDPEHSAIEFRRLVCVTSRDSHRAERDAHRRSPDFFDAERHPHTNMELDDDSSLAVVRPLMVKGITRQIELDGTFQGADVGPDGSERIGSELRGELARGLTWNRLLESGLRAGNTVQLALDVTAVRAA
jgi:polyisoprenoid-binding protein YceI